MDGDALIVPTDRGLYCPAGDFFIDAWKPVARNVVTHAHADHARRGSEHYLAAEEGQGLLRHRLGADISLHALPYGQPLSMNDVRLSLHPAGHVRGSAQVRLERAGNIWLFTGDYKRDPDPTCSPFELVRCHTLITECTFGLPIFTWTDPAGVGRDINQWWRENQMAGRTSILLAYALGKAQRVMSMLDASIGPILLHGAVLSMTEAYRAGGVELPQTGHASPEAARQHRGKALVIAPPAALNSTWSRKFAPFSSGVASGWMKVRGFRRRRAADRGFVLSDHVDFPSLLATIEQSGADQVIATHGYTDALTRLLLEKGKRAEALATEFGDDEEEGSDA